MTEKKWILYVDDEECLVLLGADLLEDYGYEVICAYNGLEALNLFQQQPDQFGVVITDETMPGMTGIELAQEVFKLAPEIPVVLCSGHMLSMYEDGMAATNIKAVLAKTDVCTRLPDLLESILPGTKEH